MSPSPAAPLPGCDLGRATCTWCLSLLICEMGTGQALLLQVGVGRMRSYVENYRSTRWVPHGHPMPGYYLLAAGTGIGDPPPPGKAWDGCCGKRDNQPDSESVRQDHPCLHSWQIRDVTQSFFSISPPTSPTEWPHQLCPPPRRLCLGMTHAHAICLARSPPQPSGNPEFLLPHLPWPPGQSSLPTQESGCLVGGKHPQGRGPSSATCQHVGPISQPQLPHLESQHERAQYNQIE